jgi:hypothetical protein
MKKEEYPGRTIFTHGYIFRTDLETEKRIRAYLLNTDAALVYQKHCIGKLFVKEESPVETLNRGELAK